MGRTFFITIGNAVAVAIGIQRIGFKVDLVSVIKSVIIGVNLERVCSVSVNFLAVFESVAVGIFVVRLSALLVLLKIC